jgi:hypothetical protein
MDLISFIFSNDLDSLSLKENKWKEYNEMILRENTDTEKEYPMKINLDYPMEFDQRIERISTFIEKDIWSQLKVLLEHPMINQSSLNEICEEYHLNLMKMMLKQKNSSIPLYPSLSEFNSIFNNLFQSFSNFYLKSEPFKEVKLKLWSELKLKDKRSKIELKNDQSYKLIRRLKKDSFQLIMEHLDQWDIDIGM